MAAQRESINKAAKVVCELVFEGGSITPALHEAAQRLLRLADAGGTYRKQYENHDERVLNRHLNLYRNKAEAATTASVRLHWQSKVAEQEEKLRRFKREQAGGRVGLDLDGL